MIVNDRGAGEPLAVRSVDNSAMSALSTLVLLLELIVPGQCDEVLGRNLAGWMAIFDDGVGSEVPVEVVFALTRFGDEAVEPLAGRLAKGTPVRQAAALEALSLMGRQNDAARETVLATLEAQDVRLVQNAVLAVTLIGESARSAEERLRELQESVPRVQHRDWAEDERVAERVERLLANALVSIGAEPVANGVRFDKDGPFDTWLAERASKEDSFTELEVVEDERLAGGLGWYTHWPGRTMHALGASAIWSPEVARREDGTLEVFLHWDTGTLRCEKIANGYGMSRGESYGGRAVLRFPRGQLDSATAAIWMRAGRGDYVRIEEISGVIRTRPAASVRGASRPVAFEFLSSRDETPLFWARGFVEVP